MIRGQYGKKRKSAWKLQDMHGKSHHGKVTQKRTKSWRQLGQCYMSKVRKKHMCKRSRKKRRAKRKEARQAQPDRQRKGGQSYRHTRRASREERPGKVTERPQPREDTWTRMGRRSKRKSTPTMQQRESAAIQWKKGEQKKGTEEAHTE